MTNEVLNFCNRAKLGYLRYLEQLKPSTAKWMIYEDCNLSSNGNLYFIFRSTQNGITFSFSREKATEEDLSLIRTEHEEIADFFREIKYDLLKINK